MSSLGDIADKVALVNWSSFNGPEYYNPERVKNALLDLTSVENEIENSTAYNEVLFGIGNNHAGTYYPVATEAVKIIVDILKSNYSEMSRNCCLEILTDLYCSFEPEIGGSIGLTSQEIERLVTDEIESSEKIFLDMLSLPSESDRNKYLVRDLLLAIYEPK